MITNVTPLNIVISRQHDSNLPSLILSPSHPTVLKTHYRSNPSFLHKFITLPSLFFTIHFQQRMPPSLFHKNMSNFSNTPSSLLLFFLLALPLCLCTTSSTTSNDFQLGAEFLTVPADQLVGSLKTTIDVIRQVTPIFSQFGNLFGDFRLSNAISDCLDLMDFSADELSWTLSASQNPKGTIMSCQLASYESFTFFFPLKRSEHVEEGSI